PLPRRGELRSPARAAPPRRARRRRAPRPRTGPPPGRGRTGTREGRGPRASLPRPEAPLALLVLGDRAREGLAREVGPELVAEDELRVGALPEQIVGDPLLPAGADQQVRVVHLRGIEMALERLLPAPVVGPRGVQDLRAPSIVEGHEKRDPV